jgi:hypothetical protein
MHLGPEVSEATKYSRSHQKNTWNLELHHNTRAQIIHLSLRLHYLGTRYVVLDLTYVLEIIELSRV